MQHPSTCSSSRRSFLRGCGLTLSGFGVASLFPTPFIDQALAGTTSNDRRLLFIFLRGGNDGLNAVIPHGDPAYSASIRPNLYIAPQEAIDLNGFASLHPALGDLVDLYNAGDLAVIHRVGYANNSKSHFDGERVWENGDPSRSHLFEGWLYRYIRDNGVNAGVTLPALTVQKTSSVLLRGAEPFVNIAKPESFAYPLEGARGEKFKRDWSGIAARLSGLEPYRPVLSQTGVRLADTMDEYASWDHAGWNPLDPDTGDPLFPVSNDTDPDDRYTSGAYDFFRSLKICALSLLESGADSPNGTRVAGTQLLGFDHHGGQGRLDGSQPMLLSWLAHGIRALNIALSGAAIDPRGYPAIWEKTTVVTLSEFGRTTEENGSLGTDHGAASCMFAAGGSINGGVYNCDAGSWPDGVIFGAEGRYLLERTDYRSIFWEILRDHMGAAPGTVDAVFPNYTALGLGGQEPGLFQR